MEKFASGAVTLEAAKHVTNVMDKFVFGTVTLEDDFFLCKRLLGLLKLFIHICLDLLAFHLLRLLGLCTC